MTPDVAPQDLELGVVGNCEVAALIDAWGRIVWACLPRLDGDPVFCGLLKPDAGSSESGVFAIDLHNFSHAEQQLLAQHGGARDRAVRQRGRRAAHRRFLPALPCARAFFPAAHVHAADRGGGRAAACDAAPATRSATTAPPSRTATKARIT